jgi:hypothetical protein
MYGRLYNSWRISADARSIVKSLPRSSLHMRKILTFTTFSTLDRVHDKLSKFRSLHQNWLGGVVGYHVSLTRHSPSDTEGPEFKPRLSHHFFLLFCDHYAHGVWFELSEKWIDFLALVAGILGCHRQVSRYLITLVALSFSSTMTVSKLSFSKFSSSMTISPLLFVFTCPRLYHT